MVIYACNKEIAGKELDMEQNGMTDTQWKDMLKMLLEILKNEDKEKAIEFIQSLLDK